MRDFLTRYGNWAVVAGASEGLGAAFATELAKRGMHLVLVARRADALRAVADRLRQDHGIEVRVLVLDLVSPSLAEALSNATVDLELGVIVYNAAFVPVANFLELEDDALDQLMRVNVHGPLTFLRALLPPMRERGRGAVVLMSSLAGMQGAPRLAAYVASKAFNTVLAEGLWYELSGRGIDVVVSCPGAISTPRYLKSTTRIAPGTMTPDAVARQTLDALGKGPRVVPGTVNRIFASLFERLLPRRTAIRLMAANTKDLT